MIIAVDFDGTLVQDKFPEIGEAFTLRMRCVKLLRKHGHKVILWTCRTGKHLEDAVEFCKKHGVEFDAVNCNLPEVQEKWGGDTRKVYCDYYIDDKGRPETALNELWISAINPNYMK